MPFRRGPELAFDWLLAASLLAWAALGLYEYGASTVRVAIAALHLTVAYLLINRSTASRGASIPDILKSLPALATAGIALWLAAPAETWPLPARSLFVLGTSVAILALLGLGKSFAVLPARRELVGEGLYRLVRHPVYAGELMMVFACFIAHPMPASAAVALLALPFVGLRIHTEERFLAGCEDYRSYQREVRWRLVPGLW